MPLYEEPPSSAVVNMRQFARSRETPATAEEPYRVQRMELRGPEEHGNRPGVWTQGKIALGTPYCGQNCAFQHMAQKGINVEHAEQWTHVPAVNSRYSPGSNQKPPTDKQLTPLQLPLQIVREGEGVGHAFGPERPEQTIARRSNGRQHCANCGKPV